jgi:hypothetical protein
MKKKCIAKFSNFALRLNFDRENKIWVIKPPEPLCTCLTKTASHNMPYRTRLVKTTASPPEVDFSTLADSCYYTTKHTNPNTHRPHTQPNTQEPTHGSSSQKENEKNKKKSRKRQNPTIKRLSI